MKTLKNILLFLLINLSFISIGQEDSYTFTGFFRGANLNVQCREKPTMPWVKCECFDSIAVNGITIDDILYEGLQVDLANKSELEIFDTVEVTFYFANPCNFRLLNPNDFLPEVIEAVDTTYIDTNGIIYWTTAQNYPELKLWVQIEQYKWGEWTKIGFNYPVKKEKRYQADVSDYIHNGENQFRVVVASIDHDRVPSDTLFFNSDKRKIRYRIEEGNIIFDQKTHFKVIDENSFLTTRGVKNFINISELKIPDGNYTINFGNQIDTVKVIDSKAVDE